MSWFYLALLAPLLYAFVNLLDDNLLQFVYNSPYMAAAMSGFFGATPLLSLIWLRADGLKWTLAGPMILAGFCLALFFFFYFKALEVEQPSVVIAMLNLVPASLPFLGYFLLHEKLGGLEISGFVLVLLASLLLAAIDIRKFKFNAALLPVLAGVVVMDISSLLSKYVYQKAPFYA
ncbi:MAG: EamA family transporter, partial [Candidatus Saccharimonadales bacterium]